jgi:GR25 family glycosyltransferase involved in LPS biosynthesis
MNTLMNIIENYNVKTITINNTKNHLLNNKIHSIFVINLLEDCIKRNYIITLMNKLKINFTLVIVDKITESIYQTLCPLAHISKEELGCCLSHLWCLNKIIENKYENAIIFEDDIIIHKDFVKQIMKIDFTHCDFLLLGAHDYNFSSLNYKHVKENHLYHPDEKTMNLYGAHANYYSLKAASCMFEIRTSCISFFDKEYMLLFNHFKNSSFVCYPNLVVTDVSKSSLNHAKDFFSINEADYYQKCFVHFQFQHYHFIYLQMLHKSLLTKILQEIKNDNYEELITNYLQKIINDPNKMEILKKRLTMNFFTIQNIKTIMEI